MPDRPVDPGPPREGDAFDRTSGFSGQDYSPAQEKAVGRRAADPPPAVDPARAKAGRPDLPPDNGRRGSIDPATGEVHGTGVGAGGGQPGEDFDSDAASGDGYPLTGGEGADRRSGDLGPPHVGK